VRPGSILDYRDDDDDDDDDDDNDDYDGDDYDGYDAAFLSRDYLNDCRYFCLAAVNCMQKLRSS
jgi:hypothetical protein